jgi:hypothetical protein
MGRTGFGWLGIGSSGGLWCAQFEFHKESRLLFDKLNDYKLVPLSKQVFLMNMKVKLVHIFQSIFKFILILSSHLHLGLPSSLITTGFPTKTDDIKIIVVNSVLPDCIIMS